jgi:hypothetical protein
VPGLDLSRLVAVAAVVFYHYGFWGRPRTACRRSHFRISPPYAQYGFLGVPIFFTISGFVIAYSAEGRTPAGFAIARFSRIYPTFLFCRTLTFATIHLLGGTNFEVASRSGSPICSSSRPLSANPFRNDVMQRFGSNTGSARPYLEGTFQPAGLYTHRMRTALGWTCGGRW